MAEGNSRHAWEIINSHRFMDHLPTSPSPESPADIDDESRFGFVDDYLNRNTEYKDLVDGWSAVLSSNYNSVSSQLFLENHRAPPDFAVAEHEFDNQESSDSSVKDPSVTNPSLTDPSVTNSSVTNPSKHSSSNTNGVAYGHRVSSHNVTDLNPDFIAQELEEANTLLDIVNAQLNERFIDLPDISPNVEELSSLNTSEQVNGVSAPLSVESHTGSAHAEPFNLVPVDCSIPKNKNELRDTDLSLGAVEVALAHPSLLDTTSLDKEMSQLSASIAECLREKALLEDQINQDSLTEHWVKEPPIALYGDDGERYLLYPDINSGTEAKNVTLENKLEHQLEEFISERESVHMSRVAKWNEEENENKNVPIFSLPDEVILKVFSYIPIKQIMTILSLVCRQWYILSFDPSLWRHLIIPSDSAIDPQWICYLASRSPLLKTLSIRGGHNLKEESLSVITNHCHQLTTVDMGFCDVTLPMLTQLVTRCPRISAVNFEGCECVSSGWIQQLCTLQHLMFVDLSHCVKIADDDIIYLSENTESLIYINVDGQSFLSDRSVVPLCNKHRDTLKLLSIDGAESTDASLEAISECQSLVKLTVSFSDRLTDTTIDYLQRLRQLKHLQIRKNQEIRSEAFRSLFHGPSMSNLQHLDLSECLSVDDSVVQAICKCCPHLTNLLLCWCWNITDQGLECIVENCEWITHLDLLGIDQIEGQSFNQLPKKLSHLVFLNLVQCNRIQDDLIRKVLARMPQLTAINFYHEDFRKAT